VLILAAGAAGCAGPGEFHGFRTSDGIGIAADLWVPEGASETAPAPLVVLAHQLYRDRSSWAPLVPRLVESGWAVLAPDRRGFGGSRAEVASAAELRGERLANFHLDLLEGIAAVANRPGVDASRVAIVASGVSVGSAVTTARLDPSVRSLVLMSGLIPAEEEEFLLANPEQPVLLVAAEADARGAGLMRQYARRLTGPSQEYLELAAGSAAGPEGWEGTDALRPETELADAIVWFLERTITAAPNQR
jgi:pimeloyl-ACP methyl ester carboxylesterase